MDSTIIKKLRFKPGVKSAIINPPKDFHKSFSKLAGDTDILKELRSGLEWMLVFVSGKKDIDKLGPRAIGAASPDTILWFAYPKKTSSIKTDITRDKGWDVVHNRGWAGVSMISIDETWSAFRIKPQKSEPVRPTSDTAVKGATGKNWKQWFREMEAFGAKEKPHKEIAKVLSKNYKLDGWWSQMITNAFEQEIGRRQKHQMSDGYQVSVSKTFPVSVSKAYKSFVDEKLRRKWLKDPGFEISTAREDKSIRALWIDGKTRISVDFYDKGEKGKEKCQVVVQHMKLPSSEVGEKKKAYWKEILEGFPL